jgi:hypothetical protein
VVICKVNRLTIAISPGPDGQGRELSTASCPV